MPAALVCLRGWQEQGVQCCKNWQSADSMAHLSAASKQIAGCAPAALQILSLLLWLTQTGCRGACSPDLCAWGAATGPAAL